jgi:hypothetical protein
VQQVGNDVDYVIDATGKGLAHIGKVIVDNIQAGLVCLFNKALSLAGITPNEFWMQVEQLGGAVDGFVRRGRDLAGNFLAGANLGLERFTGKLKENFLDAVAGWLKVPPALFSLLVDFVDVSKLAGVALELVGYDWDSLIGLVQEAVGQQNYAVVATVLEELGDANDQGIEGYLNSKLPILKSDLDGDKDLFATLTKNLKDLVPAMLEETIKSAAHH